MKKKWILIAVCFVLLLSLLAIGGGDSFGSKFASRFGDAMDWKSWWLAGRHSINCGRVPVHGDRKPKGNLSEWSTTLWATMLPLQEESLGRLMANYMP